MTDEQCSSLEVLISVDGDGFRCSLSCWQPSKEDIDAINAGRPIWLKVIGAFHPPVALCTTDGHGNANV